MADLLHKLKKYKAYLQAHPNGDKVRYFNRKNPRDHSIDYFDIKAALFLTSSLNNFRMTTRMVLYDSCCFEFCTGDD